MENTNLKDLIKDVKPRKLHFVNTKASSKLKPNNFNTQFLKTERDGKGKFKYIGFELIISKDSDIYKEINDGRDSIPESNNIYKVKSVDIICDTLILKDSLRVPTADINIYARKIVLENNVEISTKPLNYFPEISEGDKGANGLNGGSICIFSNEIINNSFSLKFISNGGNGQNAKQGQNGKDGNSVTSYRTYQDFPFEAKRPLMASVWTTIKAVFSYNEHDGTYKESGIKCVAYKARWKFDAGYLQTHELSSFGSFSKIPTDGEDAIAPGKPGEPGDAGTISFIKSLQEKIQIDNSGGYAGFKASDVRGGRKGTPEKWCYADFNLYTNDWNGLNTSYRITKDLKGDNIKIIGYTCGNTKDGIGYTATAAQRQRGDNGRVIVNEYNYCWIAPELLTIISQYTKTTYLKNESRESIIELLAILKDYKIALDASNLSWGEEDMFIWNKAKLFINKIISQILTHRDYFNNQAGYMPLFNLSSSMCLYETNTSNSIKKLVLASYFKAQAKKAFSEQETLDEVNNTILSNIKQTSSKHQTLKDKIKNVESEIEIILKKSDSITTDLLLLEEQLIVEAKNGLHDEKIVKFGIKMGAALLQVIPYGQPALGAVGNIVSVIGDAYGGEIDDYKKSVSDVIKTKSFSEILKKTKENLTDTTEALISFETISKEVKDEKSADAIKLKLHEASKKSNEKKVTQTSTSKQLNAVGANLASAIGDVSSAFNGLKITEEELESSLNKIKISNEEWLKLQNQIIEINKEKAKFILSYEELMQEIIDNLEKAESNAIAYSSIKELRGNKEGFRNAYVNDFFNSMEEETKDSLIYQLYLLTKSCENTLFESVEMEWGSENIFDKVMIEINKDPNFNFTKIKSVSESIESIFKNNLDIVRNSLIKNATKINSKELVRTIKFNREEIDQLNNSGSININPILYPGVIPNNFHFIKLKDILIKEDSIKYSNDISIKDINPNSSISLRVEKEGLTRVSDKLYISRGDEKIISWSFDRTKSWVKDPISESAKDLFKILIGSEYQDYLTLYPGITPLKLEFNILTQLEKKIEIEELEIIIKLEVVDLNSSNKSYVLNIMDPKLPVSFNMLKNGLEFVNLPKNSITIIEEKNVSYNVVGNYYTIVKNPNVKLIADQDYLMFPFSHWEIKYTNQEPKKVKNIDLELSLDNVISIIPYYGQKLEVFTMSTASTKNKSTSKIVESSERFIPQPLFAKPNEDQIYFISDNDKIEILESDENGWMKINDNGVVGYVKNK